MSCSRWLSIQSSLVLATPVDSHCVSRESRRFGAIKTSIPSTPFSTRASLPGSRQIYRAFREERLNSASITLAWATDSAKQLVLWEEPLPGYVVTREPSFFAPLPSCAAFQRGAPEFVVLVQFLAVRDLPLGPLAQEEPSAEARRGLFGELAELSVSRPISLVPPMLSPFRPMLF